ncbi:Plastid ribosomal protein L28 [Cymbomonas tetramitiformis]|uniref:Large ribosomal subunit protein bL28c n=1 Tax=Cymbomonas tetramitiformis TaxID=36881 RepID=A0AAE0LBM5_9CHLO|nr:Plastid ribosomal protein L28 [Cymbomonas tetramitiformis]
MATTLNTKFSLSQAFSKKCSFSNGAALRTSTPATPVARVRVQPVQMSRVCDLTGKKANNGYVVTFSHKRNKKLQQVNLQMKKVFWEKEKRWVKMKVSTKGLKSINKVGLEEMAKRANIDLYSLPFVDVSEARTEWLKENNKPPVKKNKRAMNQEKYQAKIAASS